MGRIESIQEYVNSILSEMKSEINRENARIHTYGVAQCCSLLALRRGLDSELAYISGLLHDIYAYKTGISKYHALNGADMARVVIRHMDFSEDEKTIILSAIYQHTSKGFIGSAYDEVLKDADVLQPFINSKAAQGFHRRKRLEKILSELNITLGTALRDINEAVQQETSDHVSARFQRNLLADVAESLAPKKICGDMEDGDFTQIIKYFPEKTAYDELKFAWCAAFVYHCVLKAGLELPIRHKPMANTRFACVEAWLRWGEEKGFCFYEKDGFLPSRGDIVIYNDVIPPENKPANTPWYDHIGIILSVDGDKLLVAEGNVNNRNYSGIVERERNDHIGCFVRIPDGYEFDGWKYDYKTEKRLEQL